MRKNTTTHRTAFFLAALCVAALLATTLGGCGILIGKAMVMGTGVEELEVTSGDAATLERGATLLVVAPFELDGDAYYIARGDDEARFTVEFAGLGTFKTLYHFEHAPGASGKLVEELKGLTPAEVAAKLELPEEPAYVLFGTILSRENIVAPMHGVVSKVAFELRFTKLGTGETVTMRCAVKELFKDTIPSLAVAIDELVPRR